MKTLITYFSWSNNTKTIISEINQKFNFETLRIEREIPYSKDYTECAYVEAKEEWQNKAFPSIKEINIDVNQYDNILIFFPIWWYTFPRPVASFVKDYLKDYKGKVVIFANSYTNDLAYMDNSVKDFKEINPNLNLTLGLFNKSIDEHINYIKKEI